MMDQFVQACMHHHSPGLNMLTHWGRVTHICVSKPTIIGSDNGLSPDRRQAIIWTIAGILLIGPLGTNFSEIFIGIQRFPFKKMHLKMSSAKWRPFCLGLNVLKHSSICRVNGLMCEDYDRISVNPLRAKFFRGNINIYLHFVSFLHIDTTQVFEILPQIRQEPTYSTQSISWLLMSWRRKEPGHQ